jgi:hypothetical protein
MPQQESTAEVGEIQALFRDVNDRVKTINQRLEPILPMQQYACECGDVGCFERVDVTADEYEAVRRDARRFIVAPSQEHVVPKAEIVVERHQRFWVVEKFGEAADIVKQRRADNS